MNEPSENEETNLTILSAQNGLVESVEEEDEMVDAAREAGMVVLSSSVVAELYKIGVDATNQGLTETAKGKLISTMAGLEEMERLTLNVARTTRKVSTRLAAASIYATLAKSSQGCALAIDARGLATPKKSDGPKKMFKIVNQVPNSIPTAS